MDSIVEEEEKDVAAESTAIEGEETTTLDDEEEIVTEPQYSKANELKFHSLCRRMEKLWRLKREKPKRPPSHEEKMKCLLPPKLLASIEPQSAFPLLRLLMPDKDSARRTLMKEKTIAKTYCDALGFHPGQRTYQMLYNFTDPTIVTDGVSAGDFSLVLEHVLAKRISHTASQLTVGDVNTLLDDLSNLAQRYNYNKSNHDWRTFQPQNHHQFTAFESQSSQTQNTNYNWNNNSNNKKKKPPKLSKLREAWACKLIGKGLSPLEHKWIVRILLENLQFGIGWESILRWYNPYSMELWNAHNSLRSLCNKVCNPNFIKQREEHARREHQQQQMASQQKQNIFYLPTPSDPIALGNTITPMLAQRGNFQKMLFDISEPHRNFSLMANNNNDSRINSNKNNKATASLALRFPTFSCEVKLDGERMIVQIQKGIVTMHTRNGTWYSRVYSPVLGPALRRSISKYDVDVILDGEIVAWDNVRKELVPFGNNRTIAIYRRKWMAKKGLLDSKDEGLHDNNNNSNDNNNNNNDNDNDDDDKNIMRGASQFWSYHNLSKQQEDGGGGDDEESAAGAECWLKFVAFDVLYVSGPDASILFADSDLPSYHLAALSSDSNTNKKHRNNNNLDDGGSITFLDGMERKKILYRLIQLQENEIEIVPSLIIRSNGRSANGEDYFSPTNPIKECDVPAYRLDSIPCTLREEEEEETPSLSMLSLSTIDDERRRGLSDSRISQERAFAIDQFYQEIVNIKHCEGIVCKDLAAPYILTRTKQWRKLKPDYAYTNGEGGSAGSAVSDLDVVIIGAYFATGLRLAGQLSSFLCACLDSEDSDCEHFFTLCRINGRSVSEDRLRAIMEHTGFRKRKAAAYGEGNTTQELDYGKWFREADHGKSLPSFISRRTFQQVEGEEDSNNIGWRFDRRKTYPDLWIHPEDSAVLTVKAGEIVASDDYSAGLTLRFPRITRVRIERSSQGGDGDAKPASDIESEETLHRIYREIVQQRSVSRGGKDFQIHSPSKPMKNYSATNCRFLTVEEYIQSQKNKRSFSTRSKNYYGGQARRSLQMPPSQLESKESTALCGLSFTVLEGTYTFEDNSLETDEAKKEGWFEDAMAVTSSYTIKCFIKKHGGIVKISADEDTIILGGMSNDARVVVLREALAANGRNTSCFAGGVLKWTYAYSLVHRWLNSKKGDDEDTDVEREDYDDNEMNSIKIRSPALLRPRFFEYLVDTESSYSRSKFKKNSDDDIEKVLADTINSTAMLERALALVGKRRQHQQAVKSGVLTKRRKTHGADDPSSSLSTDGEKLPWQHAALLHLDENDRWIVACGFQTLWPYDNISNNSSDKNKHKASTLIERSTSTNIGGTDDSIVVVYPDVFSPGSKDNALNNYVTLSKQQQQPPGLQYLFTSNSSTNCDGWDRVSPDLKFSNICACLPLLRAMGCLITPYQHEGVTHILCELNCDSIDKDHFTLELGMTSSAVLKYFKDPQRGQCLLDRLHNLKKSSCSSSGGVDKGSTARAIVTFVSPNWVNSKWKEGEVTFDKN